MEETISRNSVPEITSESLRLSIGGLLSVGGFTAHCAKRGLLINTALSLQVRAVPAPSCAVALTDSLQVVTGTGDLVECDADRNSDLFRACLGGLGQVQSAGLSLSILSAQVSASMASSSSPSCGSRQCRTAL